MLGTSIYLKRKVIGRSEYLTIVLKETQRYIKIYNIANIDFVFLFYYHSKTRIYFVKNFR